MISDIAEVINIEKDSFSSPWGFKDFLSLSLNRKNLFFVAVKNGVVGYVVAEIIENWMKSKIEIHGHLLNIAVDLNHRKKGIGLKLMDLIFKKLRESRAEKIYLEVRLSNKRAKEFYKKLGFFEIKKLQNYYKNEDGILMESKIK
jgi:ribosomal-protein-alanine N-acetyltransferase